MPIFEYQCRLGHIQERIFLRYNNIPDKLQCDTCWKEYNLEDDGCINWAERIWSLPSNIQHGAPTIVFTNPRTGESQVATSKHEQPPPGFTKSELKSPIERTKFENTQNEIYRQQDEIYNENVRQRSEEFRKQRVDQLNSEMSSICAESDNPSATETLMKAAINRKRKPLKQRKTQFKLEVNHVDKSNL